MSTPGTMMPAPQTAPPTIDWNTYEAATPQPTGTPAPAPTSSQGAQPQIDWNTYQPTGGGSATPGFFENLGAGGSQDIEQLKQQAIGAGKGVWDIAKGAAQGIWNSVPGVQLGKSIHQSLNALDTYEKARSSGLGVKDSLIAANKTVDQAAAVKEEFHNRVDEFKKNPTQEGVRAVVDILPLVLAAYGGYQALAGEGGAAGGAGAGLEDEDIIPPVQPKPQAPGIVRQAIQGKQAVRPAATAALRQGVEAGGEIGTGETPLRSTLEHPIQANDTFASTMYKQVDEATGVDIKTLQQKLDNTEFKLRQLTDTPEDSAKETDLMKSRQGLINKINSAKANAAKQGIDPDALDQADAAYKKARALEEVEARVFKNPSIVQGNAKFGTPESVDIDRAVTTLQKLADKDKFGGNRLEQAFGKDGADSMLNEMYRIQRIGNAAERVRQFRILATKVLGVGVAAGTVEHLLR